MRCHNCDVNFNDTELCYIEVTEFILSNERETLRFCGYTCLKVGLGL
jgi:hypothetical protein